MLGKKSAGILLYRIGNYGIEVLLVHPGGPFWKNKDAGAWSIPKGEFDETEVPLEAAKREFKEETGQEVDGEFIELSPLKQKSGKWVYAWACEHNLDETSITSNNFDMVWPPKSGKLQSFPEVGKAAWFSVKDAKHKINPGQAGFIDELLLKLMQ